MSEAKRTCMRADARWLALFVFMAVVLAPSLVFAATTWSNVQPPPLTSTAITSPAISLEVDDDYLLYPMSTMRIDGVYVRSRFTWITYSDWTRGRVTATAPTLADGSHVVFVDIPRQAGRGHITYTWTFTVGSAPVVSNPVPAENARIDDATPLIKADVSDTGPIASVTVWVDDAEVPSTFAGGVVSAQVTEPLLDDSAHTARVVAEDSAGLLTELAWSFYVQTLPPMPVDTTCAECHVGYPDSHPVDDCLACHGQGSPYETGYDDPAESHAPGGPCYPCHMNLTDCSWCHEGDYATVPALHDMVDDTYHDSSLAECSPCHVRRVSVEHNRYGLDCMTCHGSTDTSVVAAVAAGDADCYGCHSGGHEALHGSPLDDLCLECHQPQLITEHGDRGLTCATCHGSSDPTVVDAIAAGDTSCQACHGISGHQEQHAASISSACEACHAPNLIDEHLTNQVLSCSTCHDSTDQSVIDAIVAGDTDCLACHSFESHPYVSGPHESTVANQTLSGTLIDTGGNPLYFGNGLPATYADQQCGWCHTMDLYAEHTKPTSVTSALQCGACHPTPRSSFASWNQTCQQADCHVSYHDDMAAKHHWSYSGTTASCGAASDSCHSGQWADDLAAIHDEQAYWGSYFGFDFAPYPNGCRLCHGSSAAPATPTSCSQCHVDAHWVANLP